MAAVTHPVSSPIVRSFRDKIVKGALTLLGGEHFCTRVVRSRKAAVTRGWPVPFPRFRCSGRFELWSPEPASVGPETRPMPRSRASKTTSRYHVSVSIYIYTCCYYRTTRRSGRGARTVARVRSFDTTGAHRVFVEAAAAHSCADNATIPDLIVGPSSDMRGTSTSFAIRYRRCSEYHAKSVQDIFQSTHTCIICGVIGILDMFHEPPDFRVFPIFQGTCSL